MKKKDEQKLEEMQQEIDEAEAAQEDAAEGSEEEAPEEAAAADAAMQEEIEALKGQVDGLNKDLQEKKDRLLRLQADFDNFRRRSAKEREEISAVVTQNFCKDMLPLLDNFERAMAAETKDVEAFQKGVEMIFTQFQEILKKNGLEHIEAVGQKFDPNFHQAVMRVEDPEKEDDTVAQELQKGYMVKGRVIRPSMVQVVSN
ncbi:nucleotide exchange factor GrpE [Mitsuokella jalaludinii]|jgi:molecular chaperone GrpE|nr:nucleotide exchange factor GrpE [Mitsuokella jalaludinii]MCI6606773.1 nucleotide exchange factor GrpE [Mitsuokella jalaludinii]MCI6612100.1 nucleotide exchange factor GrpE [Mitsuokella jalaludinii]MCI7717352.1 nucleotide exchange factor GrpE [Mitsuokella jalaludinii]MCQ1531950.1 nucleotide exchange factor GrpE [Mitsuokella jalaludinii]